MGFKGKGRTDSSSSADGLGGAGEFVMSQTKIQATGGWIAQAERNWVMLPVLFSVLPHAFWGIRPQATINLTRDGYIYVGTLRLNFL